MISTRPKTVLITEIHAIFHEMPKALRLTKAHRCNLSFYYNTTIENTNFNLTTKINNIRTISIMVLIIVILSHLIPPNLKMLKQLKFSHPFFPLIPKFVWKWPLRELSEIKTVLMYVNLKQRNVMPQTKFPCDSQFHLQFV